MSSDRVPRVQNVVAKLRIIDERVIAVRQLHHLIVTRSLDTDKGSARELKAESPVQPRNDKEPGGVWLGPRSRGHAYYVQRSTQHGKI